MGASTGLGVKNGVTTDRYRYFVLGLGCLCLTVTSSNLFTFNIAQVCMSTTSNVTRLEFFPSRDYTPGEVSMLNQAMGIGTLITTLPFIEIFNRKGIKWPFFVGAIVSMISTALMPFASEWGFYWLMALRFIQGASYGGNFPAIGVLCMNWASLKQSGLFASVLTSYTPLSLGITNTVSGLLCSSPLGWPSVYFTHAVATGILLVLWVLYYDDEPKQCRRVSVVELEKITRNKSNAHVQGHLKTPYRTLLTDPVLLVIWANVLFETFANNVLAVYSPYYIRNVLRYGIIETGYFSALCTVAQIPVRMVCGILSDRIEFLSEDHKLVLFNTFSLGGSGTIYMAMGFLSNVNPLVVVILFTCISLCTGASSCGFVKASILYGRQYTNFVIGACQFLKSVTLFLVPALAGIFVTKEDSEDQWKLIYIGTAVTLYVSNALFWKYATAEPPEYTRDGYFDQKPSLATIGGFDDSLKNTANGNSSHSSDVDFTARPNRDNPNTKTTQRL